MQHVRNGLPIIFVLYTWANSLNSLGLCLLICKVGIVTSMSISLWGLNIYKNLTLSGPPIPLWAYILYSMIPTVAYSSPAALTSWESLQFIRQVPTSRPLHQFFPFLRHFPFGYLNGSSLQTLACLPLFHEVCPDYLNLFCTLLQPLLRPLALLFLLSLALTIFLQSK